MPKNSPTSFGTLRSWVHIPPSRPQRCWSEACSQASGQHLGRFFPRLSCVQILDPPRLVRPPQRSAEAVDTAQRRSRRQPRHPVSSSPCDYQWALSLRRHRWTENPDTVTDKRPNQLHFGTGSWSPVARVASLWPWNGNEEDGLEVRIDREAGAGPFGCLGLGFDRPASEPMFFGQI